MGPVQARMGVRRLIKNLDTAPVSQRILMIQALGALKKKGALQALLERFDIEKAEEEESIAIVAALGELRDQKATDRLLAAWEYLERRRLAGNDFSDGQRELRFRIPEALGKIGDIKAIPALRRGMADDQSRVAVRCVEALGVLRDSRSMDWMIRLLASPDQDLSQAAYEALALLGGDKVERALRASTKSEEPYARVMAAYGLARLGKKLGFLLLDGFIEEVDEPYKAGVLAAYYLARLGQANGLDYLVRLTKERQSNLRSVSVEILGKTKEPRAALPLAELLDDSDTNIRLMAAAALGRVGGSRAHTELKRALKKETNPGVRAGIRRALSVLGDYVPPA